MHNAYVIADLHLGHEKVARVRGFANVEAHDNALIEAWNRTVDKKDTIFVLGDVMYLHRVPELRGIKKLALGNHDTKSIIRYVGLFSQIRSCFEVEGCLLTHIPVHPSQFSRWRKNVHGHCHANPLDDPRYRCVSVECCPGSAPVLLSSTI